jgi:hypothetical protein
MSQKMNMDKLLMSNNMKYVLPTNLSVVDERRNKPSYADSQQYSGNNSSELVVRLTASSDYVYGPNCFLYCEVQATGTAPINAGFKDGTAINLWARMRMESKDGQELDRNDAFNKWSRQSIPWRICADSRNVESCMAGQVPADQVGGGYLGPLTATNGATVGSYGLDTKLTVCVPMRWISDLFGQETLIPPYLISGALLRLQFEAPLTALQQIQDTDPVVTGYTVSNARVVMDSLKISPVVAKNLMEQSQQGLKFAYRSHHYQPATVGTAGNYELQVNRAVARALSLSHSTFTRDIDPSTAVDNLGTQEFNYKNLQYRVGDLFLPAKVITNGAADATIAQKNCAEFYENTLQGNQLMKYDRKAPLVTLPLFQRVNVVDSNNGYVLLTQDYEQSSAIQFSGVAINNSRTATASIEYAESASDKGIDSWLCFYKLTSSYPQRVIVKQ